MDQCISANAVANLLGIHIKKVQRLARERQLPCLKVGAVYRFPAGALDAWVSSQTQGCPTPIRRTGKVSEELRARMTAAQRARREREKAKK